jgi:hypothetical protein
MKLISRRRTRTRLAGALAPFIAAGCLFGRGRRVSGRPGCGAGRPRCDPGPGPGCGPASVEARPDQRSDNPTVRGCPPARTRLAGGATAGSAPGSDCPHGARHGTQRALSLPNLDAYRLDRHSQSLSRLTATFALLVCRRRAMRPQGLCLDFSLSLWCQHRVSAFSRKLVAPGSSIAGAAVCWR